MSRRALQFSRNNERHLYCQGGLQVILGKSNFAQLAGYSISYAELCPIEDKQSEEPETLEEDSYLEFSEEYSEVIVELERIGVKEDCDIYLTKPLQKTENLLEVFEGLEDLEAEPCDFDVEDLLQDLFENTQGNNCCLLFPYPIY